MNGMNIQLNKRNEELKMTGYYFTKEFDWELYETEDEFWGMVEQDDWERYLAEDSYPTEEYDD